MGSAWVYEQKKRRGINQKGCRLLSCILQDKLIIPHLSKLPRINRIVHPRFAAICPEPS